MTISVTVLGHNTKIRRKTDQTNQKKKPQNLHVNVASNKVD